MLIALQPFGYLKNYPVLFFQTRPFCHVYFGGLEGQPPDVATQPSRLDGGSKAQRTKNLAVSSKKIPSNPKWSIFGRNWWILRGFILSHTQKKKQSHSPYSKQEWTVDIGNQQASDSTAAPCSHGQKTPAKKTCLLPDRSINAEDEERLFTDLAAAAVHPSIRHDWYGPSHGWWQPEIRVQLNQLRLVVYPHYLQGFSTIPGGWCRNSEPSTLGTTFFWQTKSLQAWKVHSERHTTDFCFLSNIIWQRKWRWNILCYGLFLLYPTFTVFSTLPFHPLPQTSFHRPKPQVVSVQVNPPVCELFKVPPKPWHLKRTLWYVGKNLIESFKSFGESITINFLGGSNLLEEVISKLNRRKRSCVQRKNFWFFAQTHPTSPLEILLGCFGFPHNFLQRFWNKSHDLELSIQMSLKYTVSQKRNSSVECWYFRFNDWVVWRFHGTEPPLNHKNQGPLTVRRPSAVFPGNTSKAFRHIRSLFPFPTMQNLWKQKSNVEMRGKKQRGRNTPYFFEVWGRLEVGFRFRDFRVDGPPSQAGESASSTIQNGRHERLSDSKTLHK